MSALVRIELVRLRSLFEIFFFLFFKLKNIKYKKLNLLLNINKKKNFFFDIFKMQ